MDIGEKDKLSNHALVQLGVDVSSICVTGVCVFLSQLSIVFGFLLLE